MGVFDIYKRGQGRYSRSLTFAGAMLLALTGAAALSSKLEAYTGPAVQYGVPALLAIVVGAVMFWIVNRPKSADFLIATEGEMKKVSWSSRKEIVGSTKVVIVGMMIMAMLLFTVDVLFAALFTFLGVLGE